MGHFGFRNLSTYPRIPLTNLAEFEKQMIARHRQQTRSGTEKSKDLGRTPFARQPMFLRDSVFQIAPQEVIPVPSCTKCVKSPQITRRPHRVDESSPPFASSPENFARTPRHDTRRSPKAMLFDVLAEKTTRLRLGKHQTLQMRSTDYATHHNAEPWKKLTNHCGRPRLIFCNLWISHALTASKDVKASQILEELTNAGKILPRKQHDLLNNPRPWRPTDRAGHHRSFTRVLQFSLTHRKARIGIGDADTLVTWANHRRNFARLFPWQKLSEYLTIRVQELELTSR